MKQLTICLFLLLATLSCSENSEVPKQNSLTGLWVPYEIKNADGLIPHHLAGVSSFTGLTIFAFYAESIQFNTDGTYFPAMWTDNDNYFILDQRKGNYEYSSSDEKIFLTGGERDMDLEVVKFSHDELWIKLDDNFYKLKRQVK